jgi:predicted amidohydrolase YtcJ
MPKRILFNTNIQFHPNTPLDPLMDALVIEDGVIQIIGKSDEIISQFGGESTIEDLNNSILLPSFTDAHIHLLEYGQSLLRINTEANTKQVCINRIADQIKKTPPGKWIVGHGWDHNIWAEGYGLKDDLDALSRHHPIYLTHKSLHCGWANSIAFEKAGIHSGTLDPENGTIQRNTSGEPTGIVFESAMKMVESAIPQLSINERKTVIQKAQSALHQYGITAVHDFDPWSIYETLTDLHHENKLTLRVTKGIPESSLDSVIENNFKSGDGNDWVKIGWLKLFADGALGPQTAAMLAPYEKSDSTGMLFLHREKIIAYGEKALPNGIAMAVHAIGDKAVHETLHAFSHLDEAGLLRIPYLKSRIEHVQIFNNDDIKLFSNHDVIASMQPIHSISDMDMAEKYWGKRCANSYAWHSIFQSGAKMVFGSDAPVESPNPFLGLHAAILRTKLGKCIAESQTWIPEQCLDLRTAIDVFTAAPSLIGDFGNMSGKIKPGFFADFIILSKDFFSKPISCIQNSTPLATMSGGKWVYKNDNIDLDIY